MTLLALLWWTSLILITLALLWMGALIAARLRRESRTRRRLRDRDRLRRICLAIVGGDGEAMAGLRPFRHRARLMAETLLGFEALVRGTERDRLIRAFDAVGMDARFRTRLGRGSRAGRLVAAEALALYPSDATAGALQRLLPGRADPALKAAAVRSLIEIGRPPALTLLLDGLGQDRTLDGGTGLAALRRVTGLDPKAALAALADPTTPPRARALLAEAIAANGDYQAVDVLCRAALSEGLDLRLAAIRGLGLLAHPAGVPTLVAAVDDAEWTVRAAACESLGRTGAAGALDAVVARLRDPVWWVRFQAAEALARLGPVGLSALRTASEAVDDTVRRVASLALAERGLVVQAGTGASR